MIPKVIEQKLGWQQSDIEELQADMKEVKNDVHTLKTGLVRVEDKLEAQSQASLTAHAKLNQEMSEIKSWIIWGVKAILGAVVTIVVAITIAFIMGD